MKDKHNLELFKRYKQQQLDPQEQKELEQRLASDPGFAAQWNFYQMAARASEELHQAEAETKALQEQLKSEGFYEEVHRQIRKEMEADQQNLPAEPALRARVSPRIFQWAMAAVLASLAFGIWMLNERTRESELARIIDAHIYANYGTYGLSEPGDDTLKQAQQLFDEKRFEEALALLDAKQSKDEEFRYLHAKILYAKGAVQQCLAETEELLKNRIFAVTRWNTELLQAEALIAVGDKSRAKYILKTIVDSDTDNPNKATVRARAIDLLNHL